MKTLRCIFMLSKNGFSMFKSVRFKSSYSYDVKGRIRIGIDEAFGRYLIITNTISAGVLMAGGDLIQQGIEQRDIMWSDKKVDWIRNRNMFVVGMAQGPFTHIFYNLLDKFLPGTKMTTIGKKICIDQLIASPVCIAMFFFGMSYLNGDSFQTSSQEFKDKFVTVYMTDCCVWPPSQFVNFYLLPTKYRVLYINLVTMLYNVFLSYMKHDYEVTPKT